MVGAEPGVKLLRCIILSGIGYKYLKVCLFVRFDRIFIKISYFKALFLFLLFLNLKDYKLPVFVDGNALWFGYAPQIIRTAPAPPLDAPLTLGLSGPPPPPPP